MQFSLGSFRVARLMGLALAALLFPVIEARAADQISDPQQVCEDISRLIGDKDIDGVVDAMIEASRGQMARSNVTAATGQIEAAVKLFGSVQLVDLMAERTYGDHVRRFWYVILFNEGQPIYIHCQLVKPDQYWQLIDFDFNSDFDKVPIP